MPNKDKKVNPRNRPATEADVNRSFTEGLDLGVNRTVRMMCYVLLEKYGWEPVDVQLFQNEVERLAANITKGSMSWSFLDKVFKENGIDIRIHS